MTRNRRDVVRSASRQSGVVLFVALILLLILSMIGVTVARMQTVEERMARNETSRQLAEQAAEAALRNAEATLLSVNTNLFANDSGGFYYFNQSNNGTAVSQLPGLDWTNAANVLPYTGPAMTNVPTTMTYPPKIVIEELPTVSPTGEALGGAGSDPAPPPNLFRVTVQGMNADGTPSVMLQTIYATF
ncbi:MAG TPA: PilX N-terminal domain-containing pilus assembly protein [Steroidobacteraceae bacterium]|nr:PilX N-terminal domain-containing pilus assembly protein [Steroidobacteraceae bacterium]